MKLKLDDAGHVVVQDNKPVYIDDDGKDVVFDIAATRQTISRLNGEAKTHREAKEAAQEALKAFEGLDATAAKKALETVSGLDAKKLIDAGEVEKVKAEIAKVYEEKLLVSDQRALKAEAALNNEIIGGSFARSKYIADNLAIPADMVQATFGKHFALENGKLTAKDANGNAIYSKTNMGELAGFDEALDIIVSGYQHRDTILKGSGANGGGALGGQGAGGKRTMSREQFNTLPSQEQHKMALAAGKGEVVITD